MKDNLKILGLNKKAGFQFELINKFEAGIVLKGTEVKSAKDSRININDAYARFIDSELWLINCHISPYKQGNINNHDPLRKRKLLLNKRELRKIRSSLEQQGFTLIPVKVFLKNSLIKLEIALAKGKKLYDKRETIKKRDIERKLNKL